MQKLRVRAIVLTAAVAVASLAGGSAMAGTGAAAAWGTAEEVPGTGALNQSGDADITSVSCGAAGNCTAGGSYRDSLYASRAFVASEVNGTWRAAITVPGTGALNKQVNSSVTSVSCASAGNCTAGGYDEIPYRRHPRVRHEQAFVVSEVNGTWGTAINVPGTAALSNSSVTSVSCVSAGTCTAGGTYEDSAGYDLVFVASEVDGTWGKALEVPGIAALNKDGNAGITSVSCGAAGNCSAGGSYYDGHRHYQAFVVSQVNGTWGKALEVPGTAALNKDGNAGITSVSCAAAGNCSAGGQGFVVSEVNGTWGTAIEAPDITSVSCAAAGNCSAGGYYTSGSSAGQAFVVSQVNGTWGTAIEVPGIAALDKGDGASVTSVSCASVGNCSAGGAYRYSRGDQTAFVVSQVNGTWGTAIRVPGIAALNKHASAGITSLSCAAVGNCSAGGTYKDSAYFRQVFVVSKT